MSRNVKITGIVVGALILIVIIIPFFIDANSFRPKLESELSSTLGRPVKVGNLSLSLFSGAVKADDIAIADDPAFSKAAFVQAKSLKVGVELLPLIFSKSLNVTELTLNQPEINLVRSQDGDKWNFSSLGGQATGAPALATTAAPASSNPNFSVTKLKVNDGRLTVSHAGSSDKPRVYDKVDITVTKFSFTNSFPFTMTASLPAGGTLKLDGTAGPVNANNAALTPLQAKVMVHQMNLAASGFIDPASGISGRHAQRRQAAGSAERVASRKAAATEILRHLRSRKTNRDFERGRRNRGQGCGAPFGNLRLARNNYQCESEIGRARDAGG
jgi:AsmA protein